MVNRKHQTGLFDAYLNGKLKGADLQCFEEKLRTDFALAEALAEHKDFIKGIQYAKEKKIREMMTSVQSELEVENFFDKNFQKIEKEIQKPVAKVISFRRIFAYAASGLILLSMAFFYTFGTNNSASQKELFAAFYQSEKTVLPNVLDQLDAQGFSSESDGQKKLLLDVLKHYEAGDFPKARTALSDFLTDYPDNKTANFYFGLTLLELEKFPTAAARLTSLSLDPDFEYTDEAAWYAALAYGQFETPEGKKNTKRLMMGIAKNEGSRFSDKAAEYLNLMK